ncbi:MAG: hypothetical protein IJ088_08345 [Clostridia bacterium]|nr:hypothetical protein [Clostridia bacterium]
MRKFLILLVLMISLGTLCLAETETVTLFSETYEGGMLTILPWSDTGTLEDPNYKVVFSVLGYMDAVVHLTNGDTANPAEMDALQKLLETAVGLSYVNVGRVKDATLVAFTDTKETVIIRYVPLQKLVTYQRMSGIPDLADWEEKTQINAQDFLYVTNEFAGTISDAVSGK